jgi:hypothetical protein
MTVFSDAFDQLPAYLDLSEGNVVPEEATEAHFKTAIKDLKEDQGLIDSYDYQGVITYLDAGVLLNEWRDRVQMYQVYIRPDVLAATVALTLHTAFEEMAGRLNYSGNAFQTELEGIVTEVNERKAGVR